VEPDSSLPRSQDTATCPYPAPEGTLSINHLVRYVVTQ